MWEPGGMNQHRERARQLWQRLKAADSHVAVAAAGYAAVVTDEAAAYLELTREPLVHEIPALMPELVATARSPGASAPRVYAALIAGHADSALSTALLEGMRGSVEPCEYAGGGCMIIGETLDQVVASLLDVSPDPAIVARLELARTVDSFRHAPVWTEPYTDGPHSWGRSFGELLQREDLALEIDAIEEMSRMPAPAGLYGAILLCKLDPGRGRAALARLAESVRPVSVYDPMNRAKTTVAVSGIARSWLARATH